MKIVEATVLCLSISLSEEILVPHNGFPLSTLLDSSAERGGRSQHFQTEVFENFK